MKKNSKSEISNLWKLSGIIVLVYFISLALIYLIFGSWKSGSEFGDASGAINTLFTGLAFAGVIFTIFLQREELILQRRELGLTRDELKGQKEEFHTQNETLKKQQFDTTFFQLLSLHHKIVDNIDSIEKYSFSSGYGLTEYITNRETRERIIYGRDVFKKKYYDMQKDLSNQDTEEGISNCYLKYYDDFQTDVGHYFRNLYRIIKFVDNSEISDKYNYTSIVRAQVSDYELLWIFYNCISINGREKFRPLIEKYCLFKNLPIDKLASESHRKLFYKDSAFIKQN